MRAWYLVSTMAVLVTATFPVMSAERPTLPEPLTLEAALQAFDAEHPMVTLIAAEQQNAQAALLNASAQNDLSLGLSLQGRWIDPSELAEHDENDDSRAALKLRKNLYDFGRSSKSVEAAQQQLEAKTGQLQHSELQLQQLIMRRYFDVLQADLAAATANESLAIAFIGFNNARERAALGELTDLDLLRLEDNYQQQLLQQKQTAQAQRQTRARLALVLNQPDNLSITLLEPNLPGLKNPLPDYAVLLQEMEQNNPELQALRSSLAAASTAREAAAAQANPQLYFEVEAVEYQRVSSSRNPLTAILGLDVPLYSGDRTRVAKAKAEAERSRSKALLRQRQFQLRQEVLENWHEAQLLLTQLEAARVRTDLRDYALDRSRAEYELELKTNLGNNMTEQSAAREYRAKTRFNLALARARLVELTRNQSYSALGEAVAATKSEVK